MTTRTVLIVSFLASLVMTVIGGWLRISHAPMPDLILGGAIVSWMIFVATAIYEILGSHKIDRMEKLLWTIGLIFMSAIAGIVYLLVGRKRIANTP